MDNLETLATQGTQDKYTLENTEESIKNGQSRDTGNIVHKINTRQRIPKSQSRMDNLETLATQGTQDK